MIKTSNNLEPIYAIQYWLYSKRIKIQQQICPIKFSFTIFIWRQYPQHHQQKSSISQLNMSIIIKSNQLNTIVYKYLLEAGLTHTAYSMFNQARLQSSLQQFKFDIKSGHLLSLLQKALIFSQVQSHVNFGEYNQCLQPFYLLKSHTCKITQRIRQQSTTFMKQLNNNIVQCIKRTNAIYNTELVNKNYEEIVYQPRGMNYFLKFEKVKVIDGQGIEFQGEESDQLVKIDGQRDSEMAIWNKQDNVVYITRNDSFGDLTGDKVYPCTVNKKVQPLQALKLTSSALIMVFANNLVKLINRQQQQSSLQFTLPLQQAIQQIYCNPNIPSIVSFQSRNEYIVMNLKNMEQIRRGKGLLRWRGFDEYVVVGQSTCQLRSLVEQKAVLQYSQHQFSLGCYSNVETEISTNKTFFFVASHDRNKILVYTFQKQEPLYVFDFAQEQQQVKKVIWVYRNQVDYLCIMTDIAVRVWEVQLNAYCLTIDLQKYQLGQVQSIAALEKNTSQTYLLALGTDNLLVCDVANQKIQRIQSPANAIIMSNVGKNFVYVLTDETLYFLNGEKLTELFK